jgi:hypothetical protein
MDILRLSMGVKRKFRNQLFNGFLFSCFLISQSQAWHQCTDYNQKSSHKAFHIHPSLKIIIFKISNDITDNFLNKKRRA